MTDTNTMLADITRLHGDLLISRQLNNEIGPNDWDGITPDDFGMSFDYIIENHGSLTVLDPTSRAALQWLYAHLPEDCPRFGKLGFCVETDYVSSVLESLARDGLVSEPEYVEAIQENELQYAQQGEEL